jgi:hypothetical protein
MTICAGCKEEVTSARFVEGQGWFCIRKCAPKGKIQPGSVFPFTTSGIGDKPGNIEVKSMRHLRQLERQYGVQSVAFNVESKNWNDAPRGRQ